MPSTRSGFRTVHATDIKCVREATVSVEEVHLEDDLLPLHASERELGL